MVVQLKRDNKSGVLGCCDVLAGFNATQL